MNRKYGIGFTAALTALTAGSILIAPAANAADTSDFPVPGSQPASVVLNELHAMGYSTAINWVNHGVSAPLSRCQVTGYHAPGWIPAGQTTIYVDVACPGVD